MVIGFHILNDTSKLVHRSTNLIKLHGITWRPEMDHPLCFYS